MGQSRRLGRGRAWKARGLLIALAEKCALLNSFFCSERAEHEVLRVLVVLECHLQSRLDDEMENDDPGDPSYAANYWAQMLHSVPVCSQRRSLTGKSSLSSAARRRGYASHWPSADLAPASDEVSSCTLASTALGSEAKCSTCGNLRSCAHDIAACATSHSMASHSHLRMGSPKGGEAMGDADENHRLAHA